ncbi:leukotriene B4 receptor 1-like [Sardina pilchardus]|uniref:leukotriene B4 receptor 1-like n=1 Tax=Sardina pilchardus TaxID=27697 RepID=UPI002E14421F
MCGNITVVVVLVRNIKKKNFTVQLMLNLAASDILCLAMLPVWMCNLLLGWTMGLHLCSVFIFITHVAVHASVFIVTLMSVQRYVVVLYRPLWSRLGRRGERAVLVFVWVLSGALAFSPGATYGIAVDRTKCEQVFRTEVQNRAQGSHQRSATLVTSIVVTFFVFWIPHHIINAMVMVAPSEPVQSAAHRAPRQVAMGIVFLNSCVNPLLYAFNYRSLRAESAGTDSNTT